MSLSTKRDMARSESGFRTRPLFRTGRDGALPQGARRPDPGRDAADLSARRCLTIPNQPEVQGGRRHTLFRCRALDDLFGGPYN